MKKSIIIAIAWFLIIIDVTSLGMSFYYLINGLDEGCGAAATICAISHVLSLFYMVFVVCCVEEGGTKPL